MYLGRIVEIGEADDVLRAPGPPLHAGLARRDPGLPPGAAPAPAAARRRLFRDAARFRRGCRFAPRCPYAEERCRTRRSAARSHRPRRPRRRLPSGGRRQPSHHRLRGTLTVPSILIVECMQEISSFNPLPSGYESFHIERGEELWRSAASTPRSAAPCRSSRRADVDGRAGLRRPRRAAPGCCRPRLGAAVARAPRVGAGEAHRRRRHLRLASTAPWAPRANSIRRAICSTEIRALAGDNPDRHLARPARHPDRPDAAADRRPRDLPHLSARGLRRHRRARRAAAPAAPRRQAQPTHRARRHPGAGARRRARHQDRLLRRPDPRVPAPGARTARRSPPAS